MNIRLGRIHQRRSIPDSIPVVRGAKCCLWHWQTSRLCRIHRPYSHFLPRTPNEWPLDQVSLLYPEERPFAITKSPQIRMTVFALVRHEEFKVKRLQRRFIEGERAFDVADGQNNVVEHRGKGGGQVLTTRASSKLSPGRNYGLGPDPVSSSSSFQLIFI